MKISPMSMLGLVMCSFVSMQASGALITHSATFDSFNHDNFYTTGGQINPTQSEVLTFDSFDESLGTLTDVAISFESNWTLAGTMDALFVVPPAPDASPIAFGAGVSRSIMSLMLTVPSGDFVSEQKSNLSNCVGFLWCNDSDIVGGDFDGDILWEAPVTLEDFISDDLSITLSRTLSARVDDCADGVTCTQSNTNNGWFGSVFVTYNYDPLAVPEPAFWILLMMGMAGVSITRHYRAA